MAMKNQNGFMIQNLNCFLTIYRKTLNKTPFQQHSYLPVSLLELLFLLLRDFLLFVLPLDSDSLVGFRTRVSASSFVASAEREELLLCRLAHQSWSAALDHRRGTQLAGEQWYPGESGPPASSLHLSEPKLKEWNAPIVVDARNAGAKKA